MNIRKIRKELGLSQLEFARLLNVHQTAVSQWETGRTLPETEMIYRISRISGKSVGEIMDPDDGGTKSQPEKFSEVFMPDDGMLGARIRSGDSVYFRASDRISNGDIVVCETENGIAVRYFYEEAGQRLLVGASGGFSPVILRKEDRILGRVYAFRSVL